jgi:microcystin-dependent protein
MSQPYTAQIIVFPYSYAPRDWAFCEGQVIPISQNQALYSLIGTTYGGNGTTTFALPNLSERVALHEGQGPGLSNYALGQASGVPNVALTSGQLPAHNHQASLGQLADLTKLVAAPAAGNWVGPQSLGGKMFSDTTTPQDPLAGNALMMSGGSQPHDNLQPFLCLHYCIALYGIFPSRN